jgi:hypothetical protein
VIKSDHVLYFFDRNDGKIHSIISNKGDGPNQYLAISDAEVVEKTEEVYLYDGTKKVLSKYNFDGKFISSEANDFIGGFCMPDDTTFLVSYSPFVDKGYDIGVYNSKWQLLNQYIPKKHSPTGDLIHYNDFVKFNDQCYYIQTFNDTLYNIGTIGINPFLILSKGGLKAPADIATDVKKRKKEGHNYILGDYGFLASNYYFYTYYYNMEIHYEIWDIKTGSLIYRNIVKNELDKRGFPVTVNEKEMYTWPKFVANDCIYCPIEADEALKLVPGLPEDTNPIILEIKIEK